MFIAIDVGGTNSRIATFRSLEEPKVLGIKTFKHTGEYQRDLENIAGAIRELSNEPIDGIGISLAGVLDSEKTCLMVSSNLTSWMGQPIRNDLSEIFGCPVYLENDGAATALGAALYGHGKGKDFVLMIWGTGIGGTAVQQVNERIHLISMEPGHAPQDWNGPICTCGQRGCYEISCGGAGIERKYGKPAKDLTDAEWVEVLENFAQCLMNVVMMHPTKLIVLTGSVAVKQASRLPIVSKYMKERLKVFEVPELKVSDFDEYTGLYGALGLLKENLPTNSH